MIELGFIGVESKHAEYFGELFNKQKIFGNIRVTSIWGGDACTDRVNDVVNSLAINKVSNTPSDLINSVDAVLVLLRDGAKHKQYAIDALESKKPTFVDKPFTVTTKDANSIIDTAIKTATPLFGGSTLRHLHQLPLIKQIIDTTDITHVSIRYRADALSPFGGYYFYGSHLAEISTALCGNEFSTVKTIKKDRGVSAIVEYPSLVALLHSDPCVDSLEISLYGSKVSHFSIDDSKCYAIGMKKFVHMLDTGISPLDYQEILSSVNLLEKIVASF